ncbi:MAG: metal ABC transporter substrate-binding protein [Christensenellales bacterium]
MRKIARIILLLVTAIFTASGCAANVVTPEIESGEPKLKIYASFYPMYDFAQKIAGDKAEVKCVVPSGVEPHDWEPTAADIVALEQADVFIYNGAGMEHWVDDVLASLQTKTLTVVEASSNIGLIEGGHSHDHDHDHDHEHEHDHDEDHNHDHDMFEGGGLDPHVWLNPMYAKIQMENITNALIEADEANADYYEYNYNAWAAELDKLDKEYKDALSGLENSTIVVAHEAYGYLCEAYGLTQVGITGLSPDSEPNPAKMAEIIDFAKEHNIKVVFFEELASSKVADAIASAIGAKTAVLSPIEGLSDAQAQEGGDYFSVMRSNLEALKAALI